MTPDRNAIEADLAAFAELQSKVGRGPDARVEVFDEALAEVIESHEDGSTEDDEAGKPKRKKRKTPKARCLDECRRRGWIAGDVERRIPFPKPRGTTYDLFGVIDIVAIAPARLDVVLIAGQTPRIIEPAFTIGIQACPGDRHADHRVKILAEPRARQWLEVTANRLELWSWSKRGAHYERPRWELRVEQFTIGSWAG